MDEENKKVSFTSFITSLWAPLYISICMQAAKAHALVQAALQSRKNGQTPPPIIAATNAVLARNPEVYSLWNLKREVLQPIMAGPEGAAEAAKEMQLVEQCLQKNHKSYAAWHQRQWLVEQGHVNKVQDLKAVERCALLPRLPDGEFSTNPNRPLTSTHPNNKISTSQSFHMAARLICQCRHLDQVHGDPKNFHAWKYRSWLTEQLNLPPSADLDFTEALLKADPSNFSAWHMRMVALSADHSCSAQTTSELQTGTRLPGTGGTRLQGNDCDASICVEQEEGDTVAEGSCQQSDSKRAAAPVPRCTGTRVLPLSFTVIEQELKLLHEVRPWAVHGLF